jgi:hypothetical protein
MNTTKKLVVIISMLAFGGAPAVIAKPQRSARTVNGDVVGSWCLFSRVLMSTVPRHSYILA